MYSTRGRGGGARSIDEMMPVESASIVVRKVPLNVTKEQMEQIFLRAGAIKYVYFPKVPRHFTTKYCFIKFHDIRRAREAQQLFDGYRLCDQWLQVVAYDPTYKFRHSSSCQSVNITFDDEYGRLRQASAVMPRIPHTARSNERIPRTSTNSTSPSPTRPPSPSVTNPPIPRYAQPKCAFSSTTPSFLNQPSDLFLNQEIDLFSIENSNSVEFNRDSEEEGEYAGCRVIDNILLDSEVGFWTWLEQRLRIEGPLHYKTSEIDRVLLKLPFSARKHFAWPLGAFRLCDKDRFQMVGPFLCLLDQMADARAKCLAMCCNWRIPFNEFWEPIAPCEIRTSNQLLQYLRKMLIQFGPQTVDDMKIRQVLQSLSSELQANCETKIQTPSGFIEFLDLPNSKKVFRISGISFYLNQEHTHILKLPNDEMKKDGTEQGDKQENF